MEVRTKGCRGPDRKNNQTLELSYFFRAQHMLKPVLLNSAYLIFNSVRNCITFLA